MPNWISGGRLANSKSVRRIDTVHRQVVLPQMPEAFEGLRITHVSDLHIGHILGPESLPAIIDSVNALQGDMIAVTGDFVDLSVKVLDKVIPALRMLAAPLGVHMVMGNHDYLDDGPALISRFREAGLGLLMNESVHLEHNGARLHVSGIDFAHQHEKLGAYVDHIFNRPLTSGNNGKAESKTTDNGGGNGYDRSASGNGGLPASDLRLLLSHHPHAFDHACRHDVHLTLAGHTHGGQVVVSANRGKRGSIGLGSLGFRYPRGLYRKGHHYLYVTTGVGSWFPLRVKCPAEIACLTLTRQASDTRTPRLV